VGSSYRSESSIAKHALKTPLIYKRIAHKARSDPRKGGEVEREKIEYRTAEYLLAS